MENSNLLFSQPNQVQEAQEDIMIMCNINEMTKQFLKNSVYLHSFAPIFDDMDLNQMSRLHLYLKGLKNFKNRDQARKDFLNLARSVYGKDSDIDEFEKGYTQYNINNILHWYTKENFLYKLINNCLRLANSDSILYSRFILKDLETAIKDKCQEQSHNFCGLLYRGTYLSDKEWIGLQKNINRNIEWHGFLSTTKVKDVAIGYCQEDRDKKALITIIVPNFLSQGEQGFADIEKYSEFPEEKEILFNVRSPFTVLEASWEQIDGFMIRHLVLLYGAQDMRRFTSDHDPCFEVQIDITETTRCKSCEKKIDLIQKPLIAVDICSKDEYLCKECVKQPQITRGLVLLCLSPSSLAENNQNKNIQIEGTIIRYQDKDINPFYGAKCVGCQTTEMSCCRRCLDCLDKQTIFCNDCFIKQNFGNPCGKKGHEWIEDCLQVQFYGYKCVGCQSTKPLSCYKCLTCQERRNTYCNNCFNDEKSNSCLKKGHMMILESYPFGFWSEKMSEKEINRLMYQAEGIAETSHLFQQGSIFLEAQNYYKAIKYFQKFIEKNSDSKNKETATCYNNLGFTYDKLGEYRKSIGYYEKSLEIFKEVLGDNHPDTAPSYNSLGSSYDHLGEYKKAIEYYLKSLEIHKTWFGEVHSKTAHIYNNLGEAYRKLGQFAKAKENHDQSLKIFQVVFGENHPNTATSYNNLAVAFCSLGEYRESIEYYFKALEIRKAVIGDKHPDTASSYNNIAVVYYHLEEYKKAIEYYSKGLEIDKIMVGDNHPKIATSYGNFGKVYEGLGDFRKAMEYYSKSLEINKAALGENHDQTANSYNNLAHANHLLGNYQKAKEIFSKSLEIHKAVLGENHHHTGISYCGLGLAYNALGDYQKAKENHYQSLKIFQILFGDSHRETADSYNNLGNVYMGLGQVEKAIENYMKSLEIFKVVVGENNSSTAICYDNLGGAYSRLKDYKKAIEYKSKTLEIRKALFGGNHLNIASSYNNIGVVYQQLGEYDKAIEYHSKSLEIQKAAFGDNHPETAASYHNLGEAYYVSGKYHRALEYHTKCFHINKTLLGENHPTLGNFYEKQGSIYIYLGEFHRALESYSTALERMKVAFGDNHPSTINCSGIVLILRQHLNKRLTLIDFSQKKSEITTN